jgi:hypothetical protein
MTLSRTTLVAIPVKRLRVDSEAIVAAVGTPYDNPVMRQMRPAVFIEGVGVGVGLSVCVVGLAFLSLSPTLSWIPEAPLLAAGLLLPLIAFGLAGYRAGRRSGRLVVGALAGAVAGAIAGGVGGLSYVFFGKPVLNVVVGLMLGSVTGALVGAAAASVGRRRD